MAAAEAKDDQIQMRVSKNEKKEITKAAEASGFDKVSAYLLFLHRQNAKKLKKS